MSKKLEWIEWYHELEKYYAEHGNIDVPFKYETEEGLKLGIWLSTQRRAYKGKGTSRISKDQIQMLNNLGMIWNKHSESWDTYYYALEEYYRKHGNIDVTQKYETEEGLKLGRWLCTQRIFCSDINREKLLNDLGMIWDKREDRWDTYYYALEEYYKKYGNIDVTQKYETEEGLKLGEWLSTQRRAYKEKGKCKITKDQIQLLNDLGMIWDKHEEAWYTYYYALEKYYEEHRNIDVPRDYETENEVKLGVWITNQRQAYKGKGANKLTKDQIQILNDLNIDWSTKIIKLLNTKITKENSDKYYRALNDRLNHVLADINYEASNEITKDNQGELCKQIIKRIWR